MLSTLIKKTQRGKKDVNIKKINGSIKIVCVCVDDKTKSVSTECIDIWSNTCAEQLCPNHWDHSLVGPSQAFSIRQRLRDWEPSETELQYALGKRFKCHFSNASKFNFLLYRKYKIVSTSTVPLLSFSTTYSNKMHTRAVIFCCLVFCALRFLLVSFRTQLELPFAVPVCNALF